MREEIAKRALERLLKCRDEDFVRSLQDFLAKEVSLKSLEIRELSIPRREAHRSAISNSNERRTLLIRWNDVEDNWGIAECACWEEPSYTSEYLRGAVVLIEDQLFPRLPQRSSVGQIVQIFNEMRGWRFTIGALFDSLCDLIRRSGGDDPLDCWPGRRLTEVSVGVVLGEFTDREAAISQVGKAVEAGYRRIKLKLSNTTDIGILKAVREVYPDAPLGFDANGSLRESDAHVLNELAAFRPIVVEQPFPSDCLDWCVALKERYPSIRICLDESIGGLGDLNTAHLLGAVDEVNIKPGRVGGMLETLAIMDYCAARKLPAWIGGMFETGVGRRASLRYASRLPSTTIHDLSPSQNYLEADIVSPYLEMSKRGNVDSMKEEPVKLDEGVIRKYTKRRTRLVR